MTVIKLVPARKPRIKAAAHRALANAMSTQDPAAAVIVSLGRDGSFALRSIAINGSFRDFDIYSRAIAIIDKARMSLIE